MQACSKLSPGQLKEVKGTWEKKNSEVINFKSLDQDSVEISRPDKLTPSKK